MAFTKKQARSLAKAWRARGYAVPAKIRRKLRNPGTPGGARKARRKRAAKTRRGRARLRKYYTHRKNLRGYKITARRKAGRRKANKKWARSVRMRRPTGRKGTIAFRKPVGRGRFKLMATNPRRRRRRQRRRNPRRGGAKAQAISIKNWTSGLTNLPQNIPALFKGKMIPKVFAATGGAIGSMVVGNTIGTRLMAMLPLPPNKYVVGGVNAAITYSGGYLLGSLLLKGENKRSFITGSAIAAIANLLMPGIVHRGLMSIPVINTMIAALPGMDGLGGYVLAPGYQGVGAYVSAPGYQGVGMLPGDMVAGIGSDDALAGELGTYVQAPSYQGVGLFGSSHLDQ